MTAPAIHKVESDVFDPAGGDTATLTGVGFTGASDVRVGVTAATDVTVVSDTNITCTMPAKAAGVYPLSVKTAGGRTSLAAAVEYANAGTIPDCIWWLRPDDADVDVDGSTEVTVWRDKSGIGDANRNVTPPTANNPAWNASDADYGGKPTVGTFRRTGNFRLASGVWNSTYSTYSLCVIGNVLDGSTFGYLLHESVTDYNAILIDSTVSECIGKAYPANSVNPAGNLYLKRSIATMVCVGGLSNARVNTGTPSTFDAGACTLGDAAMNVGSYPDASETFGVDKIATVAAWSRALTSREIRTLRRGRDSYYGAPA